MFRDKVNNCIELVGYGHPDRFADYIAELILDKALEQDENSKVAIEVLATRNSISLGGELTTKAKLDFEEIVYGAIESTYGERWWPNYKDTVKVYNHISEQSKELTTIQNKSKKIVAGDQGVIYGYYNESRFATIETLYGLMRAVREKFEVSPDWKLLFTDFTDWDKKQDVKELSMSVCGDVDHSKVKTFVEKWIRKHHIGFREMEVIINPKGKWLVSGPLADTGVVGRKLMIDTFGAGIPHGGGAFCGKDVSKVDKTGVLMALHIARHHYANNKQDMYKDIYAGKNYDEEVLVELHFKIGDLKPRIFVNGKPDKWSWDLDFFINTDKLHKVKWAELVKEGSAISWMKKYCVPQWAHRWGIDEE